MSDLTTAMREHRAQLRAYFDGPGFQQLSGISTTDRLLSPRRFVRARHAYLLELAMRWVRERFPEVAGGTQALDAGCGAGMLSVALARRGFQVMAVDLAPHMIDITASSARRAQVAQRLRVMTGDLTSVAGVFELVCCLNVLIYYPAHLLPPLLAHLAAATRSNLLLTYIAEQPQRWPLDPLWNAFVHDRRGPAVETVSAAALAELLEQVGLRALRQQRVGGLHPGLTLLEAAPRSQESGE